MSEVLTMKSKLISVGSAAADERALAEVERWMEMIREIGREEISRERPAAFQALTEDYFSSN